MALDPISVIFKAIDQMSQPLQSIASQALNTEKAVEALKAAAAKFGEAFKTDKVAAELGAIDDEVLGLAQSLGKTYAEAEKLVKSLGLAPAEINKAVASIKQMESVKIHPDAQFRQLSQSLGISREQFDGLRKSAIDVGEAGSRGLGGMVGKLAGIGTAFLGLKGAIDVAMGAIGGFYQAAIVSNEQLNAQLLSSQTNLASATRIFADGKEITDPTEKIQATRGALDKAIKTIQKETQSLVGVTSSQVNELFQTTLQNAADLNNQAKGMLDKTGKDISKEFNDPIAASTKLTKGWAASLKVIGVPLNQAGQEINSILKGQVDSNSILAKSLRITNEQVNQWKAQGRLVTELNERLNTFVEGNAIAANSIDGIMSNIQDYFDLFAREVGKPLLQPIIDALAEVFKVIDSNKDFIFGTLNAIGTALGTVIGGGLKALVAVLGTAFQGLVNLMQTLAPAADAVGSALSAAFGAVSTVLAPIGEMLMGLLNSPIGQFVAQVASLAAVFAAVAVGVAVVAPIIGGIGTAIAGVVGSFGVFGGVVASVTGLFTGFGAAVTGAFGFISTLIAGLGGISGIIASAGAALSGFGATVLGALGGIPALIAGIPALLGGIGSAIVGAFGALPGLLAGAFGAIPALLGAAFAAVSTFVTVTLPAAIAFAAPIIGMVAAIGAAIAAAVAILSQVPAFFGQIIEPAGKLLQTVGILASAVLGGLFGKLAPLISATGQGLGWLAGIIGGALGGAFGLVQKAAFTVFDTLGKLVGGAINMIQSTIAGLVDNPAFQVLAEAMGINIEQVKKSLDELGKAQTDATDKQKEADKAAEDGGKSLEFKSKSLTELGNSYKQLSEKAANAQAAIDNEGGGDPARFAAAAKELIELTQKQVEMGQISQAEADKRLSAIANNTKVEVDTQTAARDAIGKLREEETKDNTAALDQQIKDTESAVKRKEISETEGAKRIADLKRQQLQEQIAANQEAIAAEEAAISKGSGSKGKLEELQRQQSDLNRQLKDQDLSNAESVAKAETDTKKRELDVQKANLDAQLAQVEAARATGSMSEEQAAIKTTEIKRQQLQIQLQDIQAQIAQAQAANDPTKVAQLKAQETKIQADITKQGAESQKAVFDAKLKDFEEKEKKTTDTVKLAEAERKAEIDKQVAAGTLTREQAESKKLELTKQTIQQEIDAERKKLAILQAMKADSPEAQKQKDAKVLESRKRLADLTGQLAQNEIQQQEKLKQGAEKSQEDAKQKAVKAIEDRAKAVQNAYTAQAQALQPQVMLQDAIAKAIDNQQKLLQSTTQLMQSQYDIAASMAESAGDQEQSQQIRLEAKGAEIAALGREFELERQKQAVLAQQEQIKLRIQQIQARAETAAAVADLAKAKAGGASPEEIQAAQLKIQASQLKEVGLSQQGALLNEQQQIDAQVLGQQQSGKMLKARADYAKMTEGTEDDAAIGREALAGARASSQQAAQQGQALSQALPALPTAQGGEIEPGNLLGGLFASLGKASAGGVTVPGALPPNPVTPGTTPPAAPGVAPGAQATPGGAAPGAGGGIGAVQPVFNNFFDGDPKKTKAAGAALSKQLAVALGEILKGAATKTKSSK